MVDIVIASKDPDYYLLISHILSEAGFDVHLAATSPEVSGMAVRVKPTAILLDCQSGDDFAIKACLDLKADPATFTIPLVALIGPGAEGQYLGLLQAGLSESFVRPITPSNLIAFLKRLAGMPRSVGPTVPAASGLAYSDIEIDLAAHKVTRNGRIIHLGPIEFRMLRHLVEHAGQVCSRDALVEAAWQQGRFVDRRTVNVHIGRLRQTLSETGGDLIQTVRSAGYILEESRGATRRAEGGGGSAA